MGRGDNKLNGARQIAATQVDKLNVKSDTETLYRFNLNQVNKVELLLSGVSKRTDVDIELYMLKRPLVQALGQIGAIDFRRLRSGQRQTYLQWMATSTRLGNRQKRLTMDHLDAGDYVVRVKHRSGKKLRYSLQSTVTPIIPLDTIAPTAAKRDTDVIFTNSTFTFDITYSDNVAVDINSIGVGDVLVTGPNGYSELATPIKVDVLSNGTPRTVTYQAIAPEKILDSADSGKYTIALQANQVTDTGGLAVAPGVLGSFEVSVNTQTEVTSDRFTFTGIPDGDAVRFEIDFSRSRDEDPREDYGLFKGAIYSANYSYMRSSGYLPSGSGTRNFQPSNISLKTIDGVLSYNPGDLISFKTSNGETEFRSVLFSEDGYAFCIGFNAKVDAQVDPDSLSSLKTAMAEKDMVQGQKDFASRSSQIFQQGTLQLENVQLSKFLKAYTVSYHLLSDQQNYVLPFFDVSGYQYHPDYDFDAVAGRFFVLGNELDNSITGNNGHDSLSGFKGNDQLYGQGNNDSLYGGEGSDRLNGGTGDDSLYGEQGDDSLYGDLGNDSLYGDLGNDTLYGGDGNDSLTGCNSLNQYFDEHDTLIGGDGSDRFHLAGYNPETQKNEVFYVGSGDGYAIIKDWKSGFDKLDVYGFDRNQFRFEYKNVIGSSTPDIEVYYTSGTVNDRIAIIQDTTAIFNPAVDFA
jgi:hypothetical protein